MRRSECDFEQASLKKLRVKYPRFILSDWNLKLILASVRFYTKRHDYYDKKSLFMVSDERILPFVNYQF